jgi:hypothetical protein
MLGDRGLAELTLDELDAARADSSNRAETEDIAGGLAQLFGIGDCKAHPMSVRDAQYAGMKLAGLGLAGDPGLFCRPVAISQWKFPSMQSYEA